MTSTRVIRPKSFKVNTTYARNTRPVSLPTPAKFRLDTGVFQDIGAKLVRPQSRKEKSWIARSKGLRTSAGLEAQLLKEEGLKISIGDKTLKQLLEVEVPDMSKQEYIKDDGSVGVRMVPVLDAQGNPVMVKKTLSIPGSIEHAQKPLMKKLEDIEAVLGDMKMPEEQKQDASVLLLTGIMQNTDLTNTMLNQIDKVTNKMGALNMVNEIPAADLIDGRFINSSFITRNRGFVKTLAFMQARGFGYTPEYPLRAVGLGPDLLQPINILDNLRTLGNPDDLLFDVRTNTFLLKANADQYVGERPVPPAARVIPPVPEEVKELVPTPGAIPIVPFNNLIMGRFVNTDYVLNNLPFIKQFAANQAGFLGRDQNNAIRILIPEINADSMVTVNTLDNIAGIHGGDVYFDTATNTIIASTNADAYNARTGKLKTELRAKSAAVAVGLSGFSRALKSRINFNAFNLGSAAQQLQTVQAAQAQLAGVPALGQLPQVQAPPQVQPPQVGVIPIMQGPPPGPPPPGPQAFGQAVIQEQKFQAPGVVQPPAQEEIGPAIPQMESRPIAEEVKALPAAIQIPPPQPSPAPSREEGEEVVNILHVSEAEEKSFDSLQEKGLNPNGFYLHIRQAPVFDNSLSNIIRGFGSVNTTPAIDQKLGFSLTNLTSDEAKLLQRMRRLDFIRTTTAPVRTAPTVTFILNEEELVSRGVGLGGIVKLRALGLNIDRVIELTGIASLGMDEILAGRTPSQHTTQELVQELGIDPMTIGDDPEAYDAFVAIYRIGREHSGRGKKEFYTMDRQPFYYAKTRIGKVLTNGYGYIRPRTSMASEIFTFG